MYNLVDILINVFNYDLFNMLKKLKQCVWPYLKGVPIQGAFVAFLVWYLFADFAQLSELHGMNGTRRNATAFFPPLQKNE